MLFSAKQKCMEFLPRNCSCKITKTILGDFLDLKLESLWRALLVTSLTVIVLHSNFL